MQAITFENLNSFAGLPVVIDPATIDEQVSFTMDAAGIATSRTSICASCSRRWDSMSRLRMARVRWMQPPEAMPQRGHMTLNVAVNRGLVSERRRVRGDDTDGRR